MLQNDCNHGNFIYGLIDHLLKVCKTITTDKSNFEVRFEFQLTFLS